MKVGAARGCEWVAVGRERRGRTTIAPDDGVELGLGTFRDARVES